MLATDQHVGVRQIFMRAARVSLDRVRFRRAHTDRECCEEGPSQDWPEPFRIRHDRRNQHRQTHRGPPESWWPNAARASFCELAS